MAIGDKFGIPKGENTLGRLVAALRMIGLTKSMIPLVSRSYRDGRVKRTGRGVWNPRIFRCFHFLLSGMGKIL
ncbi:MAG: hypothetical protein ACLUJR_02035 [Mediterraneibacter gnavus]